MQFLVLVITGSVYVKMVNKKGCKVGGFKFRLWGLRFGGFGFDKDPPLEREYSRTGLGSSV